MGRDILHTFAVDSDLTSVAQPGAIFLSGSDHAFTSPIARARLATTGRQINA
jgi:hypothetical protein